MDEYNRVSSANMAFYPVLPCYLMQAYKNYHWTQRKGKMDRLFITIRIYNTFHKIRCLSLVQNSIEKQLDL